MFAVIQLTLLHPLHIMRSVPAHFIQPAPMRSHFKNNASETLAKRRAGLHHAVAIIEPLNRSLCFKPVEWVGRVIEGVTPK